MKNKFKLVLSTLVCLLSITQTVFSEDVHPIKKIPFHEGDQLTLSLSNIDVNRLAVADDLLATVSCPSNMCVTHQDKTGSAYVTLNTATPFSLFAVTQTGRHFSILVTPTAEPGLTYELIPQDSNEKALHWEEEGPYAERLVDLIKSMMRGETPEGYGYHSVSEAVSVPFANSASLTLIARYQGDHFSGLVYEIHSNLKKSLLLTPNGFYDKNVKAVALSTQSLEQGEVGYVYEVISTEEAI